MTDLRNVNVVADYDQKSEAWKKYGYTELPVMSTNSKKEMVGKSGMKIEVQQIGKEEPFVRVSLPDSQAFVPFEAIDDILEGMQKRVKDTFPNMKDFKIEHISKKVSRGGNTCHWIVQTSMVETVKDSFKKNDQLKLGFCISNGYNTGVALGVKLFTMRLICSNGAFAKGADLAANTIKHIGDPVALLKTFQTSLLNIVEEWTELLNVYNKMAKVKLTEKAAKYIYASTRKGWDIADRFFPDYYTIAEPKKEKTQKEVQEKVKVPVPVPVIGLTAKGKSVTLWENFNDMTFGLWRAQNDETYEDEKGNEKIRKAMAFDGLVARELRLHESIKYVAEHPEEFK